MPEGGRELTLKEYMEKHHLPVSVVAKKTGIGKVTLYKILNDKARLSKETVKKLKAIGIDEEPTTIFESLVGDIESTLPDGVARYLMVNKMTMSELSEITDIPISTLSKHINVGRKLTEKNKEKLRKLGITNFGEDNLFREIEEFGNLREDSTFVINTIFEIKSKKDGIVHLRNKRQVASVVEWLVSRGYEYRYTLLGDEHEIKFRKVGK